MLENNGKLLKVTVWPGDYTKIQHIGKFFYCFNKKWKHLSRNLSLFYKYTSRMFI